MSAEDEDDDESGGEGPDPEAWMLSFGDLVSLMLVFFVMLFSMSTLEQEEFQAIVSALSQQFNPAAEMVRPKPAVDMDAPKINVARGYSIDYLRALIATKMQSDPVLENIALHKLHDRLVVSLPSDTTFETGSAMLNDDARQAIYLLGDLLRYLSNRVDVNGHTDPDPINSPAFPSNWELSLSRAIAVANELRRSGFNRPVNAFGFADSRFADLSLTLPAPRRYELARRVDIVIRESESEESPF